MTTPAGKKPKPWMVRRAAALHLACEGIALDVSHDVTPGKALARARRRFNSTQIARRRGMVLTISAIRDNYAKWKANPSPSCFLNGWGGSNQPLKIGPDFARELARRAVVERVTLSGLYERLRREVPNLHFCRETLIRTLPRAPFRAVWNAQRKLDQAEKAALRFIERLPKGSA